MSSPASKEIQELKDEIEALKQDNLDQKEALEEEIKNLERKNRDYKSINANLKTEIQRLQRTNHDQNEAHEDQAQNLDQTNRDQNEAHEDQTQNQEQTNRDQNEAHEDQTQNLDQTNRDQNEAHEGQTQNQEQLCTIFSNLGVKEYNRVSVSPVSVDKSQDCTIWWCPVHSDFENIITYYRPATSADQLIVDRARDRFNYWRGNGDVGRCCFRERINRDRNDFAPPSNWPQ